MAKKQPTKKKIGRKKNAPQKKSASKGATGPSLAVKKNPKSYSTTGFAGQSTATPQKFGQAIRGIESELGMPVWLMLQNQTEFPPLAPYHISRTVFTEFCKSKDSLLKKGETIALILDSPGGDAHTAFKIATMLRRHCGSFVAVVPSYAKSAATLLALGSEKIFMGDDAELGPLDAQIVDSETEENRSVLEYVQSLERLEAFSLRSIDDMMHMLLMRTGKKINTILPHVMEMVSSLVRPLFENVDVVQYTQMARILKVAEDYAVRLLRQKYDEEAVTIASALVSNYSDHGVVIDQEEAKIIGLQIEDSSNELKQHLRIAAEYEHLSAWGKLKETTV
jgi:Serine dehydrogenase proteinase